MPLPEVPNAVPQVRQPQSPVSPGDIAAPYAALARTLDQAGEVLDKDVAQPLATEAGRNAVTAGPDGQPVIQKMPIFGNASVAYTRAAKFDALAKAQPALETEIQKIRLQYPNDPEKFKGAADEFLKGYLAKQPDPGVREALQQTGVVHVEQQHRSLLVQFDQNNKINALESLQARLAGINERGTSLARQGGTDTPEYVALHADRSAIYQELVNDPRFHFPKEKADQQLVENRDQDVVQGVIGNVLRTYKTRANTPEAQKALQDAFWGEGSEKLNLSAQKRDHGVTEGLKALQRIGVEDKQATAAMQATVMEYTRNLQSAPHAFDQVSHDSLLQRASEADPTGKLRAELDAVRIMVPLWQGLKGLTESEANSVTASIARGVVPALPVRLRDRGIQGKIEAEAQRQGVAPQTAVAIAAIESGGDPLAVKGSYRGLFQLSQDEFTRFGGQGDIHGDENIRVGVASLKAKAGAFREEFGRDPTPTDMYLMHQQGEAGYRAHLANPDAPAWQNMLSTAEGRRKGETWAKSAIWGNLPESAQRFFGSVENVKSADFINVWQQRVQGIPYEGTTLRAGQFAASDRNPYIAKLFFSTAERMRAEQGKNAEHLSDQIISMAKSRDAVPPETLSTFVTAAVGSGREDLIRKVQPELQAYDTATAAQRAGGTALVPALEAQIASVKAGGVDPLKHRMLSSVSTMLQQGADQLRANPLTEGARRGWVAAPNPIDAANPAAAAAELADRQKKIGTMRLTDPALGPMAAIGDDEAKSMKPALVQGDALTARGLLGALQTSLSPENYRATLTSKPMVEALSGMVRSRDPIRMTAAFEALDTLWQTDQWGFKTAFGEPMLDHLQAWHGMRESFTPDEIAIRLNTSDDPGAVKARADMKKVAETEFHDWHPADIAYQLGDSFGIPLTGWFARNFSGSTPGVPYDEPTQRVLFNDFKDTYVALRSYGVEKGNAVKLAAKRTASDWGASTAAGNILMKYPPEKYYGRIDGSHDWMREQLDQTVTSVLGPQVTLGGEAMRTDMPAPEGGPAPRVHWTIKGLIGDAETQADIRAGRPPSYKIVVDRGKGELEILSNAATGQSRIRFDDASDLSGVRRRYLDREQRSRDAVRASRDAFEATQGMSVF